MKNRFYFPKALNFVKAQISLDRDRIESKYTCPRNLKNLFWGWK